MRNYALWAGVAVVLLLLVGGGWFWYTHRYASAHISSATVSAQHESVISGTADNIDSVNVTITGDNLPNAIFFQVLVKDGAWTLTIPAHYFPNEFSGKFNVGVAVFKGGKMLITDGTSGTVQ